MNRFASRTTMLSMLFGSVIAVAGLSGCSSQSDDPSTRTVSFKDEVLPMLAKNCFKCHLEGGKGEQKTGLNMRTHESLMKGTNNGPVIVAGSAVSSTLYRQIAHLTAEEIRMPHNEMKLADEDIALLKAWIDQGAQNN